MNRIGPHFDVAGVKGAEVRESAGYGGVGIAVPASLDGARSGLTGFVVDLAREVARHARVPACPPAPAGSSSAGNMHSTRSS